ncbi:sodium:proline symporter [Vibrio sp. ZSDE26]|uniref:histidine kinase n=1 Tax=Vibrio amylolyticus TaxID=2847292 RepID=A0A9X1XIQ8_9VIBR|nr:ATP-binding protein [Vibrio amylolyticus]MCK6261730.1 sodium:proline symporter [Vibrio amylolyticus]
MISVGSLILIILTYVAVLFFIANWAESGSRQAKVISSSVYVYILSLAVYCTSWTFYGSVGLASRSGIIVYTIYLGPTLLMLMLYPILKRILRIKQTYHINNIADFLSARFNRSLSLAGLCSIVAMIGIIPYLALQLKAINKSIYVLLGSDTVNGAATPIDTVTSVGSGSVTWLIWLGVGIFTIVFGIRHIDPTERHPGMMLALAVEGLIKLIAMLAVGLFVCFILFDSPFDIFSKLTTEIPASASQMATPPTFMTWASYTILAASAFFMLPRQFHVMVVENARLSFIKKTQWMLPVYLFLMTMFAMPIAAAGLLLLGPQNPDTYMLTLPLSQNQNALTLLVFIGGFSASMAMLMVSGMTLATMFSNHLALPILRKIAPNNNFGNYLLQIRWFAVFLVFSAGQAFYLFLGESYMLVNMGMISFCAVFQFLPLVITGLFWKDVNAKGAILGISVGFGVWAYCLFIPAIIKSGWIDVSLLEHGLWGIEWLHPEHLFGSTMDRISHGAFWSIIANISGIVLGSIFFKESKEENRYNAEFIENMISDQEEDEHGNFDLPSNIPLQPKLEILVQIFGQYYSIADALKKTEKVLETTQLKDKPTVTTLELANLEKAAERQLSGATGSAMAHVIIQESLLFNENEKQQLEHTYTQLLGQLKISPNQLRQQLNYAKEKENLATTYNEQLKTLVEERTSELQKAMTQLQETQSQLVEKEKQASLGMLVAGVAHEINTPIGICVTASSNLQEEVKLLTKAYDSEKLSEKDLLEFFALCEESAVIIHKNNERASELIRSFKQIAVDQSSDELRDFNLKEYIDEILLSLRPQLKKSPHKLLIECPDDIYCSSYAGALSQVVTNLIMNSLIHAFKVDQVGEIKLVAKNNGDAFYLDFSDNGMGLDEESTKRLFDPFFTTKRNQGGSGLGTHLIHTLITRKLKGKVKIETALGEGLHFAMEIPKKPINS